MAAKLDQADVMTLTSLEQVRVLSDPLRMRIIEVLCQGERTTKQVAGDLGEKPTRLYHHVDALEKAGLVRQTRTRRNRGTLERYYVAAARSFQADPRLFGGNAAPDEAATMRSMMTTIFDSTAAEVARLAGRGGDAGSVGEEGVLGYLSVEADAEAMEALRRRLKRLLADIQRLAHSPGSRRASRRFRLTLAFYPLDRFEEKDAR